MSKFVSSKEKNTTGYLYSILAGYCIYASFLLYGYNPYER